MKKIALIQTLMLTLLFSMAPVAMSVQVVCAQFEGLPYDPPIVTVLSPSPNGVYSEENVPLNFTVQIRGFLYHNTESLRCLNYSLDGQAPVSMAYFLPSDLTPPYYVHANDVLTGLSNGTHNLTIYGETAISGLTGNFNETISFKVDTSNTIVEPFPTIWVIASAVIVAIVSISLLLYFKKCKH